MSTSLSKFRNILGIIVSPWTLVIAVLLISTWALTLRFFGLSKSWIFVVNSSISLLTLFILWRIQRKRKREDREISTKIDELTQHIKNAQNEKSGQKGNGFKTSALKLPR